MSVGLDSEGLLAIYADWLAFLREKQGQFAGQLAKLQGKGGGKDHQVPAPVAPSVEPVSLSAPVPEASLPAPDEAAPAWLFETTPAPDAEAVSPIPASAPKDDDPDDWM